MAIMKQPDHLFHLQGEFMTNILLILLNGYRNKDQIHVMNENVLVQNE